MAVARKLVRVLGPVQIVLPECTIDLPSVSQRRLLAALAVHAPHPVRLDWLCWVLGVSSGAVRTTVARLRRIGGDDLVHTTATGYGVGVAVDAELACAELAERCTDPDVIGRALGRWAGPALDEFRAEAWAHGAALRLDEVYATAVEDRAANLIGQGRADAAIPQLETFVADHPFRDRPRGLYLRALAATGRPTEALRSYQDYRAFLVEEVGTGPTNELRRLEQRIAAGWNGIEEEDIERRTASAAPTERVRAMPTRSVEGDNIVGRRTELDLLATAADDAERCVPQVVLVSGEAGIGKSSLISTYVRQHCDPSRWRTFFGRCDEFIGEPFQPFRRLLTDLIEELPDEALVAHASRFGGDLASLVPQIHQRIPIPARELATDPTIARHLLFQAAADVVRKSAEAGPLLIVVDDFHWAESTGRQLLVHLVRELAALPVLLVAGYRDTSEAESPEFRAALADLLRLGAHRIVLTGLDDAEIADLVRARLAGTADRDVAEVAARLSFETAGNPLYAEHLLQYWSDSTLISSSDEVVTMTSGVQPDPPPTIRDLVWRRVGALGERAGPVLGAAAVLGVEFEEDIVAAMTGADRAELDDLFDRAERAKVLAAKSSASSSARFSHAVVARSLEAELGERARIRLHGAAFDALLAAANREGSEAVTSVATRLAHHAERARRTGEARHWATVAGEDALANLAADEAVRWFRRALDHTGPERGAEELRADLLVRLGEAECRAGLVEGVGTLQAAASLAQRCGADHVMVRAALAINPGSQVRFGPGAPQQLAIVEAARSRVAHDDSATRARLEALLAQSLVHTDQHERRATAAATALELARRSGDAGVFARVAPNVLSALWAPGQAQLRSTVAAEAAAIVETLGDPSVSAALYFAAHSAAVCVGDAVSTERYRQRLRAIADELQEPRAKWLAAIVDGFAATMAGRFRAAEACIGDALAHGMRIGEPDASTIFASQGFAIGLCEGRHADLAPFVQDVVYDEASIDLSYEVARALVSVGLGEHDEPRAVLRDAIARGFETLPHNLVRSTVLLGYAALALELDDHDAAEALLPEVAGLEEKVSFNGVTGQGPVAAYTGMLLSLLGRHAEAEAHLLDALATADAFGWDYYRAAILLALALDRHRADDVDTTAEDWLAQADALCDGQDLAHLRRSLAALRTAQRSVTEQRRRDARNRHGA
ncbi:MAG: BTAD domain-containing putative transcriptional regulator [Acidimicrobiales bacterium]